ncbi:MAG TPA: DRTGG domain-containing protein [Terriglobales bacterium]|nr:DRTGG domain-containing protein [Terriglobales bacterium]
MVALKDILSSVEGELLTPGSPLDVSCSKVFASDFMSDVLTSAEPGSLLLTGLANPHVICTCSLVDIAAVVFVQGKRPDSAAIEQARANGLPLIATRLPMFEACSRLAALTTGGPHGR